jgi:hypothetical protein
LARTEGGMILSGPKACRGSTNDARILPVFLHSPVGLSCQSTSPNVICAWRRAHSLLMDEGSGLLRPSGMLAGMRNVYGGSEDCVCEKKSAVQCSAVLMQSSY